VLADPSTISTRVQLDEMARQLGVELVRFEARSPDEIVRALDVSGGASRRGECPGLTASAGGPPADHRAYAGRARAALVLEVARSADHWLGVTRVVQAPRQVEKS
jgi:hypothetical protein